MIKKILSLICLLGLLLTGCSSPAARDESVDLDLTVFSSTLLSAEIQKIMVNPDNYVGKRIKAIGTYSSFFYDETGKYYHYVVTRAGDACCMEGLEFIWSDDHVYPDDYPEEQVRIEVVGVFNTYTEHGYPYGYLAVDKITVLR